MPVAMGEDRGMGGAVTLLLAVYYSSGDNCKLFGGRDLHLISLGSLAQCPAPRDKICIKYLNLTVDSLLQKSLSKIFMLSYECYSCLPIWHYSFKKFV